MNPQSFRASLAKYAVQEGFALNVLERILAIAVVEQILFRELEAIGQQGYLKGGAGMIWRYGPSQARATSDVDVVSALEKSEVELFLRSLGGRSLDFISIDEVRINADKTKAQVPREYRLVAASVPLKIWNTKWVTVELEVLPKEDAAPAKSNLEPPNEELSSLFSELALPKLKSLPTIARELQIAEKIHALTELGSRRASDLFDIVYLVRRGGLDKDKLAKLVSTVFMRRGKHAWPPIFEPTDQFRDSYSQDWAFIDFDSAVQEFSDLLEDLNRRMGQD
jgi:hypothetical protein